MSSIGGAQPLVYVRIGRADLGSILSLDLDAAQVDRFLGPLADIVAAVRNGPAHSLTAIRADGRMVGFYVVHPDRRDAACWWIGWFALDRCSQGRGFGRAAMARIMTAFRGIAGCRRVRLLVAPDNVHAVRLYTQAEFRPVGIHVTGELVLEAAVPHQFTSGPRLRSMLRLVVTPGHASHEGRLRLAAGPYEARMIGVERGPPARRTGFGAMGCRSVRPGSHVERGGRLPRHRAPAPVTRRYSNL